MEQALAAVQLLQRERHLEQQSRGRQPVLPAAKARNKSWSWREVAVPDACAHAGLPQLREHQLHHKRGEEQWEQTEDLDTDPH